MSTGYSIDRDAPHTAAVGEITIELESRGYAVTQLPVNGDAPDLDIHGTQVEVKTGYSTDTGNVSIKVGCINHARTSTATTLFVFWDHPARVVHTYESLIRRIVYGPRRRSGTGSLTDYYLFHLNNPRGSLIRPQTTFDEWFPSLQSESEAA